MEPDLLELLIDSSKSRICLSLVDSNSFSWILVIVEDLAIPLESSGFSWNQIKVQLILGGFQCFIVDSTGFYWTPLCLI